MNAPIVFLDTETTGIGPDDEPWEIAAIRRDPDGAETELHLFVAHNVRRVLSLPRQFRIDWATRYDPAEAVSRSDAGRQLITLIGGWEPDTDTPAEPAVIVGANPTFDLRMIAPLLDDANCDLSDLIHYRLVDVGALAYGWLSAMHQLGHHLDVDTLAALDAGLPWSSDAVSRALGILPTDFERHTAMGDVRWVKAIYDRVTGAAA